MKQHPLIGEAFLWTIPFIHDATSFRGIFSSFRCSLVPAPAAALFPLFGLVYVNFLNFLTACLLSPTSDSFVTGIIAPNTASDAWSERGLKKSTWIFSRSSAVDRARFYSRVSCVVINLVGCVFYKWSVSKTVPTYRFDDTRMVFVLCAFSIRIDINKYFLRVWTDRKSQLWD